jgi:RNase P subunit RPR2
MTSRKQTERKSREDDAAKERIETLLGLALDKFELGEDALSRRYVHLARLLAMRHRIRLGSSRFCKDCDTIFITGRTARTRIVEKKAYMVCAACGRRTRTGAKGTGKNPF